MVSKIFPDRKEEALYSTNPTLRDHVVICGYGRVGKYIGRALQMVNIPFIVVDYNETTTREPRGKEFLCCMEILRILKYSIMRR